MSRGGQQYGTDAHHHRAVSSCSRREDGMTAPLTAATAQVAALGNATKALRGVVTAALTAHPGAQAVSVTPKVQGDHAVAEITLLENGAMTTVSEPLG